MADLRATARLNKFPPNATLHVTIVSTQEFRLRIWIAKRLICLAAWVLGCGIEVKNEQNALSENR